YGQQPGAGGEEEGAGPRADGGVFVLLSALGGECLEDSALLRNDGGPEALLGVQAARGGDGAAVPGPVPRRGADG
ncbi:MAG: hypothetical protein ACUVXG_15285, partial [Anaerolineae bacterium]